MEKQVYNMDGYKLHLIKTDKFKEVTIKMMFKRPIVKEELTIRNLLFTYLMYSSKQYKTNRELAIATANLYDPYIYDNVSRYGKIIISSLNITTLNEKYTEKGMLQKNIEFFLNFFLKPNFENGKCDEEIFNIVKDSLENSLKIINESKEKRAIDQALINTNEDIVHYQRYGYVEEIAKISSKEVYNYYQTLIKDDVDIYVVGNINFEEIKDIFNNTLSLKNKYSNYKDIIYEHQHLKDNPTTIIKKEKVNQSNLVIVYKLINLTKFERHFVSEVFENILCHGMESKLFAQVREKHSLCYNIEAAILKPRNILLIIVGIDGTKFEQTKDLISDIMLEMNNGKFSASELATAKIPYLSTLKIVKDSEVAIINNDNFDNLMDLPTEEQKIKNIRMVTKNDVINFSRKIVIDNIYLLKGEADDKK